MCDQRLTREGIKINLIQKDRVKNFLQKEKKNYSNKKISYKKIQFLQTKLVNIISKIALDGVRRSGLGSFRD